MIVIKEIKRLSSLYLLFLTAIISIVLFSACKPHPKQITLPGYVEGRYSYIAANFGGILVTLNVHRGEIVKIGQTLFILDPLPEHADMEAAKAEVEQAMDDYKRTTADYNLQKSLLDRRLKLFKQGYTSLEDIDITTANYNMAYASLNAAEKNLISRKSHLKKAEWASEQKSVESPINALVFDTYYNPGDLVTNGSPVLSLLENRQIKVIFYVPQRYLAKIKLQQTVSVNCDGCDHTIKAKVTFISPQTEFTPPVIYSNEEREKLVFRIEALPMISNILDNLHPGQPIQVTLDIHYEK